MPRARRHHRRSVVVGALALCIGATTCAAAPPPVAVTPIGPTRAGVVVALVDGDTIEIRMDGRDETVRLIGIDTPETKRPGTPVECFGPEASAHLAELAPVGTAVVVETDVEERDRYGRLLAHLHRSADGRYLNGTMAADGFAAPLAIAPNGAHEAVVAAAAGAARSRGAGLWSACGGPHELVR